MSKRLRLALVLASLGAVAAIVGLGERVTIADILMGFTINLGLGYGIGSLIWGRTRSSEPDNRGVPQAATSLAPAPSAYTTSHSAKTQHGASNVKGSRIFFTAEIDDGSNALDSAFVRHEPGSREVVVTSLRAGTQVRIPMQSASLPRLDVSGATKKLYLGHLVVIFSDADMTAVEALLDAAGWSEVQLPEEAVQSDPAVAENESDIGTAGAARLDRTEIAEALRQLKALHDEGILTDEEFETKRQRLADQL